VSLPEQPPKFFVDRSLGRIAVPADQEIKDTRWIEDSAKLGWPVLMKDKRIRHRQAEVEAVVEHQARCFVITRGDLTSADYAERFITNQQTIFALCATPGPFICAVHRDRLERLRLRG
jgi:hypothetical protein